MKGMKEMGDKPARLNGNDSKKAKAPRHRAISVVSVGDLFGQGSRRQVTLLGDGRVVQSCRIEWTLRFHNGSETATHGQFSFASGRALYPRDIRPLSARFAKGDCFGDSCRH